MEFNSRDIGSKERVIYEKKIELESNINNRKGVKC
jgi:hypothetical protein